MFNALEENELNIVIDAMDVKEVNSGDLIINQGDDGDVLYLIGKGQLECTKIFKQGDAPVFLKHYE